MDGTPAWWLQVLPETRDYLLAHQRERISWHIYMDLRAAGAVLLQHDPDKSTFYISEEDWDGILCAQH